MATATQDLPSVLSHIAAAVERVRNDEPQYFPEAASIGDAVRQGDIYIQLMNDGDLATLEHLYRKLDTPVLQLAPGNSKGSRHCLASAEGVEMWQPNPTDVAVLRHVYAKNGKKLPEKFQQMSRFELAFESERREVEAAMPLAGPIFRLSKANVVTHPEHGDWHLPTGTYRIVFQRTINAAAQIERVLD